MDRTQLKYLLHSGPSRILDVRKSFCEDGCAPLFQVKTLNTAILIKQSAGSGHSSQTELPPIATKVYLPYDRNRPEDGGKSFFYTPENLRSIFLSKSADVASEAIEADCGLLTVFNKIPSFSPHILRDTLERSGKTIPDGYLSVPQRETNMIKERLRARLRPLIATAYGGSGKAIGDATIESLVDKLWALTELDELRPLIEAFRIKFEDAPEVFYCWLGIAFFENEYLKLQPQLKKMAEWMSANGSIREALPREMLDTYRRLIEQARRLLQLQWRQALSILKEYTETYDQLISGGGSAQRFIDFLRPSKTHFWTLGGCLGRLEQSVSIWDHVCSRVRYRPLTFEAGLELFGMLNGINSAAERTHVSAA